MKIEIDTQRDTKEDLLHLANMLNALAGSSGRRSVVVRPRDFEKPKNVFEDSSPSGGLFNMFGDTSQAAEPKAEPAPEQPQAGATDVFSIFNSSESASQTELEETEEKTTAKDVLDDDRIVPY